MVVFILLPANEARSKFNVLFFGRLEFDSLKKFVLNGMSRILRQEKRLTREAPRRGTKKNRLDAESDPIKYRVANGAKYGSCNALQP